MDEPINLPPLPEPDAGIHMLEFSAFSMRQYATEAARLAVLQERAAERERCAKRCDEVVASNRDCDAFDNGFQSGASSCAAAIRNQEG